MVRLGVVDYRLPVRRMNADLGRLLDGVGAVLLDFDGPVCSFFAGYPAPQAAGELVDVMRRRGVDVPPGLAGEPDSACGLAQHRGSWRPQRHAGRRRRALRGRAPSLRERRIHALRPGGHRRCSAGGTTRGGGQQ